MFVQKMIVSAAALLTAVCAFAVPSSGLKPFTRLSQPAPVYPAGLKEGFETSFRAQLSHMLGQPSDLVTVNLELSRVEPTPAFEKADSVQVLGIGSTGSSRLDGLVSLPVVVVADGRSHDLLVSGVLSVTGPVVTARAALVRGQVVGEGDLVMSRLPWRLLPSGAAGTSISSIVGRRVRNFVAAGTPVYGALVDEPFAVKSGDVVELTVLSGPGVMIRSRALARQEGRMGDMVRIEQQDTKKALRGVITGDKKVEVRL
jgi:flagella basal body P-ring formation protein FlgA